MSIIKSEHLVQLGQDYKGDFPKIKSSTTAEQKFHQWVKEHLPGHQQRIESNTALGIPDLNMCWQGSEVWAELKVPVNGRVLLRKEQFAWGVRRAVNGGSVFILANFSDIIYVWKYQAVVFHVEPYSKYLWLKDMPLERIPKDDVAKLCRILFEL